MYNEQVMKKTIVQVLVLTVIALMIAAGCSNPSRGGGGGSVSHTVTFDVNGGTLGEGLDTRTVDDGAAIGTLPVLIRENYGFDGWFTQADGGTQYTGTSTVTAGITLYAHWVINAHTVTFDVNGGNPLGEEATLAVSHGAAIGTLPTPTRTGYGFAGWFTQTDGGTQYSDPSATVTADITLYAKWNPITVWDDGTSIADGFAGGGGSSVTDPYIISAVAELAYLAQQVNAGTDYAGKYFTLTGNLDLNRQEWTAIGTSANRFRGRFDGDGHVISGLFINKPGADYQGLFGSLNGGVSNLGLVDVTITGKDRVGGIAGFVHGGGSIDNCYSTGDVSGTSGVGGIAGVVDNSSIDNCYSTGAVSGTSGVGGIAGVVNNSSSIENCYSTGAVSGGSQVGGIAGVVYASSIDNSYSTGAVSGTGDYTGGIAGLIHSSSRIDNSYSTGAVSGTNHIGGIAGYIHSSSSIDNCAALNFTVTASTSSANSAGRVVGFINGTNNTFTGNVAWDTMGTGGGKAFTAGTDYNGTLQAKTAFHSAAGFPFNVNAAPWTYAAGKLPVLDGLAGQSNALPTHLE
jgi:uncharacterized repeat protein (TIGR02543 family)